MIAGHLAVERDGAAELRFGLVRLGRLGGDDADHVMSAGVFRTLGDDPAIDLRRRRDLAAPVKRDRFLQLPIHVVQAAYPSAQSAAAQSISCRRILARGGTSCDDFT